MCKGDTDLNRMRFSVHRAKEIVILLRILVHDCNYGYKLTNGMAMVRQSAPSLCSPLICPCES